MATLSQYLNHALNLQQQGKHQESISLLKQLVKQAPKQVQIPWLIGTAYLAEKDFQRSENYLKKALKLEPSNPDVLNAMGMLKLELKEYQGAYAAFQKIYEHQKDNTVLLANLVLAAKHLSRFDEAIEYARQANALSGGDKLYAFRYANTLSDADRFDEAIETLIDITSKHPRYIEAWLNLGNNLKIKCRFDEAKSAYEQALKLNPDNPAIQFNLGLLLLREGESARGWDLYEGRRELVEFQDANLRKLSSAYWNGEPLEGKTILIYSEQGRGDTLHYCRYLAWVKSLGAERVVLYSDPKMRSLFSSLDGLDECVNEGEPLPKHHYRVSIMSLPSVYFQLSGNFDFARPYLEASASSVSFWKSYFDEQASVASSSDKLRIGIVWQGNPGFTWDRYRSIPLQELSPIIADDAFSVVSLQVFDPTKQLDKLKKQNIGVYKKIDDPSSVIKKRGAEYDDTAGLLAHIDVVVTTDTSMAHLCGALGKKTLLLQGAYSDWRYGVDEKYVPDYPSMILCREDEWGDWPSAVAKAHTYLRELATATQKDKR